MDATQGPSEDDLLSHLRTLERALHQPSVRADLTRLDALLHDSFVEFGSSGRVFSKADLLQQLPTESHPSAVLAQDFAVAPLGEGIALLTYRSAHVDGDGRTSRHTLRATLWQRTPAGWQARFHQGTATAAFDCPAP
ncbi:MAG: nuclear transport factor 2 family protein [Pseudomonadota bacterium]